MIILEVQILTKICKKFLKFENFRMPRKVRKAHRLSTEPKSGELLAKKNIDSFQLHSQVYSTTAID